jgi:hypothetical protein
MEEDYIKLATLINDLKTSEWRDQALVELPAFLTDMIVNKGDKYMVGVFRMYLKTYQQFYDSHEEYEPWERLH